ncbi:MAG: LLM class flavin-dependent oxidoreductase [Acidimicrobiales bacterium]
MITASTAWELAEATDGKFLLGLGTQVKAHIERRFSSEFEPPGPRLREYIQAVRACFNAFDGREKLDFKGQYYNLTLLPDTWKPGKIAHPDIPIYISAVGPWMTRMAGEVAGRDPRAPVAFRAVPQRGAAAQGGRGRRHRRSFGG